MRSHSRSPGPSRAPVEIPQQIVGRRADGPGACSPASRLRTLAARCKTRSRMPGRLASRASISLKSGRVGTVPLLEVLLQRLLAEALQLLGGDVAAGLVLRPVANLGKPALVVLAGVTADPAPRSGGGSRPVCASHPAFTAAMRAMATLCRAARVSSPPPGGSPARRCRASSPISRSRAAGLGQSLRNRPPGADPPDGNSARQ